LEADRTTDDADRVAYPHEVAGAFAYLGSSEADYITGAILSIDGAITT
jgi:NAD(P)-dependent dehydrogenase (short-subunit alcohol dehydrogenase family)